MPSFGSTSEAGPGRVGRQHPPQTSTMPSRLARTALERQSIVFLGSKCVCGYSWTSTLLAVGITPTTTACFSKGLPALPTEFTGRPIYF